MGLTSSKVVEVILKQLVAAVKKCKDYEYECTHNGPSILFIHEWFNGTSGSELNISS